MNKCPIDLLSLLNTNDVCISNSILYSWQANDYESRGLGPWSTMASNSTSKTLKSQCVHTCFSLYSTCVFCVICISHKLIYVPNWYFIIKCLKETRLFWYASNFRFKLTYGLISISKVALKFHKWNTVVFKKGHKRQECKLSWDSHRHPAHMKIPSIFLNISYMFKRTVDGHFKQFWGYQGLIHKKKIGL